MNKRNQDPTDSGTASVLESEDDQRQMLSAKLRIAVELTRTGRTRIQGVFPTQGAGPLDDGKRAQVILGEIATQLVAMGVADKPWFRA